ncbi:hypothetical protein RHMOL_Rhmol09G0176700 [Rhododendron molle]|uniref:Uncharacterized protein n=1 Tax=Rhododendron molle TaxID=49168 RepID=A0ACC0MFL2_RHOML|nr:hypothetical protein RHMOL_Rhmol09G0176700 [Rhododendron molle]
MSSSSSSTPNSRSKVERNVLCGCGVRAPLRTALTEPNVGRRFLGCVNYKKEDQACKFFEWVDPATCERGKDFGNWMLKKHNDLRKENVGLRAKIVELKEREEWFLIKMNCMNRNLKEMEDGFALKMEQYKNKKDWNELEMEDLKVDMEDLRVKMEEVEANNVQLRVKVKEVEAKNVGLRKRLKEVEYGKKLVNVLTAMVVLLLGIGIFVWLGAKGMFKKKMLALP